MKFLDITAMWVVAALSIGAIGVQGALPESSSGVAPGVVALVPGFDLNDPAVAEVMEWMTDEPGEAWPASPQYVQSGPQIAEVRRPANATARSTTGADHWRPSCS